MYCAVEGSTSLPRDLVEQHRPLSSVDGGVFEGIVQKNLCCRMEGQRLI